MISDSTITQITWSTEKRKISDLIPHPANPRKMSEKQLADLQASVEKFNLVEIPAINLNNTILAGHMRLKTMQLLGRGEEVIDVRVPSRALTQEEESEYLIRSNKNTGEWDFDLLANFEEDLLKDVGFDSTELDKIFQLDAKPEDDNVPDVRKETDIKIGDMFKLGEHVLLCGDCTTQANVERLMGQI